MAGSKSLTAREVAGGVMASEHADLLRESVAVIVREIMEAEVCQLAGAELGERVPERRVARRNGYRERQWDIRVGEIELAIPSCGPAVICRVSLSPGVVPSRRW